MQKNSADTWADWFDSYKKQFEGMYGIDPRLPLSQNALLQTLIASGVGAGIGAVRGGLWPGHQEEVLDNKQNIVKKKPNSALHGALTGGLIGAGSSAIANYAGQTVSEYKPELNKLLAGVLNGLSARIKTSELKTTALLGDSTMKKQSTAHPWSITAPHEFGHIVLKKVAALGGLQASYVADAAGADASERANILAGERAREDEDGGFITDMMGQSADAQRMINKRKRHAASSFAESPTARALNTIDPSKLITDSPDLTLTGLAMVSGKKNKEREDRVLDNYKNIIKKYQDAVNMTGPKTTRETPWHILMQGHLADTDMDIAGHKQQRKEHPLNYWLNPLDRTGPLVELGDRFRRRNLAGLAKPDSVSGRVGMGLGNLATLGLLGTLVGGASAQNKLRRSAVDNEIFDEHSMPEKIVKQSKVYDASESVENMPIKKTKMNHKCCTPGEFGARVKEARGQSYASNPGGSAPKTAPGAEADNGFWTWLAGKFGGDPVRTRVSNARRGIVTPPPPDPKGPPMVDFNPSDYAMGGGLAGGGAGALLGAVLSKKKNKLRNALLGGLAGAGAGALSGHYLGKQAASGDQYNQRIALKKKKYLNGLIDGTTTRVLAAGENPGADEELALGKNIGGWGLSTYLSPEEHKKRYGAKEEKEAASTLEDVSSYISGLYNKIPEPVRQGGGMGGVAGAALGGLSGLVAPGSKTEIGPDGKPVKKTRSRLMSAIQRAALGGAAGGAGGAAMGHFNPQLVSDIAASRQKLYDRVNPVMARDIYNPVDANPARMPNNSVDVNSGPTIA